MEQRQFFFLFFLLKTIEKKKIKKKVRSARFDPGATDEPPFTVRES